VSKKPKQSKQERRKAAIVKKTIPAWKAWDPREIAKARKQLEQVARYYDAYGNAYQQARDDFREDQGGASRDTGREGD